MSKKQISVRLSPETIAMRDALIEHFSTPIAKASAETVIDLAIKELYKAYIDKPIGSKSKTAKRYGVK